MPKEKVELIPPDMERCQAERKTGCWPDAQHFMNLGPGQMTRCSNKPTVIIVENAPGADGQRGSMALCDACLKVASEQLGAENITVIPITKRKGKL